MNPQPPTDPPRHRVVIHYCTGCRWMLRAAWMGQELLSTFEGDLSELALAPSSGGRFVVEVDGQVVWDRHRDGGFPEIKRLKQLVRDRVAPGRPLGHIDRPREEGQAADV